MVRGQRLIIHIFFLLGNSYLFAGEDLSVKAEGVLGSGIGSYLTNSFLTGTFISLCIVFGVRFMLRKGVTLIPNGGQACIENLIDGLGGILEPIVGKHAFPRIFPFLLACFVFILLQNLSGLFPGIGSIGFRRNGHFVGILRPMNADLNATLALALVATLAWGYFCLKSVGPLGFYAHIFGNKADRNEIHISIYSILFFVFFAIGLIECVSILCRVISLSFRLYGNIFGGENLLHNMYGMSEFLTSGKFVGTDFYAMLLSFSPLLATLLDGILSKLGYFLPLPFYFLEFLVAIVQAFVFTLLVTVYMGLICNHGEEELPREV